MTSLKAPRVDSGVFYLNKEVQEAGEQTDRVFSQELFPDSPNQSFAQNQMPRTSHHHDTAMQRSPMMESEGLTRPRRRMEDSMASPTLGIAEESRGLMRRRME